MSAVGLATPMRNFSYLIFRTRWRDFFLPPSSSWRGEKGGEEGRRGGSRFSIDVPRFQVHIPRPSSLPRSRSLCLWPHFPPFAGHLRAAPDVSLSLPSSVGRLELGSFLARSVDPIFPFKSRALLAASADSNFKKMSYLPCNTPTRGESIVH